MKQKMMIIRVKGFLIFLIFLFTISCTSKEEEVKYQTVNEDILSVIEGENHLNSIVENSDIENFDSLQTQLIFNLGMDKSSYKSTMSDLKEYGFVEFKVNHSKFRILTLLDLEFIVGICCVKSNNKNFIISYAALLNKECKIQTLGCAYYLDEARSSIAIGCNSIEEKLNQGVSFFKLERDDIWLQNQKLLRWLAPHWSETRN